MSEIHLIADLHPEIAIDGELTRVHPKEAAKDIGLKYRGSRISQISNMFVFCYFRKGH